MSVITARLDALWRERDELMGALIDSAATRWDALKAVAVLEQERDEARAAAREMQRDAGEALGDRYGARYPWLKDEGESDGRR